MQRGPRSESAALSLSGGAESCWREKGRRNKKRDARPTGNLELDGTGMSDGGGGRRKRGEKRRGGGVENSGAASHIHFGFNGKFVVKSPALND